MPIELDDVVDFTIRASKIEVPDFVEICLEDEKVKRNRQGGFSEEH